MFCDKHVNIIFDTVREYVINIFFLILLFVKFLQPYLFLLNLSACKNFFLHELILLTYFFIMCVDVAFFSF